MGYSRPPHSLTGKLNDGLLTIMTTLIRHYVITMHNGFMFGTEQKICMTFQDFKGPIDIKVELERNDEVNTLLKHRIDDYQHSECFAVQIPKLSRSRQSYVLHVSALGENLNVSDSKNIMIFERDVPCIIHNDKTTYKPGDIVKFHVITMNNDFKALNKKFPLIELVDPNKNRIAQWMDVTTKQGFAEFSFPLADELTFGSYKINIPDGCEKEFKVNKYESKRFEVKLTAPDEVHLTDKSFHVEVCARYTYGKPVEGIIDLSVCVESYSHMWDYREESEHDSSEDTHCFSLKGQKADSKGCFSKDIELGNINFTTTRSNTFFRIKSKLTEGTTGHSEQASTTVNGINIKSIEFKECKSVYVKGSPYHCKVQSKNDKGQPKVNEDITLYIVDEESHDVTNIKLVTDADGIAEVKLNTAEWQSNILVKAVLSSEVRDGDNLENFRYYFYEGPSPSLLWVLKYEPKTESSLTIQEHPKQISCNSDQTVTVEYNIHRKNLNADTDHLDFFYIIFEKNGIFSYKEHTVDIKDQQNVAKLHGSFPINFHVGNFFPVAQILVFAILPNGETVATATNFLVAPYIENKMKLAFSKEQVRPGEDVNLEITVEGGGLCSVRSVDKGYLLDKPHDDSYLLKIAEYFKDAFASHPLRPRLPDDYEYDIVQLFRENQLLVLTNTGSKDLAPRMSPPKKKTKDSVKEIPKHLKRSFFPDTFIFELVPVGSDGHVELNRTTPHTITKWVTDAFCLGKNGLDSVTDVEFTTFQSYFIDLILPSSVVQGEKFTIQALIFNYEKKCMLIVAALTDAEDLITAQDKEQARCVCEGHSHSFTWDVSAVKIKTQKIHVTSGALDVEGDCKEDVLLIGKDRRTDSVEKTIEIKPKGYEEEKTKTFLLFPADNRDPIAINIEAPERLVPGSERAHIIISGDLMANVFLNLESLIDLPDGCGEQNLAKFTSYINTMDYLESTEQLTPESKAEAIEAMSKGYQKQLTHKNENGSYAMFYGDGNIWLTAFVVKSYNVAKRFIPIEEKEIQDSVDWLQTKQQPNGCFEFENYYNNYVQEDGEVTCTAYVTAALLEHRFIYNGNIVENALSCLKKSLPTVTSLYAQALLAYVFTLSGDSELRDQTLEKVKQRIVEKGGYEEVETASYIILALLSDKITTIKNLEDSGDIIRWLVKRQNPWGGFGSSQVTSIALQAVAKYAKAIYRKTGDSTVTIQLKSGFEKIVHVDKSNSLFVQMVDLPDIPGEYSVSATGEGFLYIQLHVHYNVLPEKHEKEYFSFNVTTEPCDWNHASKKEFKIHVNVRYLGQRENTNMALIILDMVSGYVPDKESVNKLKKHPLVERTEISAQNITMYLKPLSHETVSLDFSVEQEADVDNLQPTTAAVLDYYDPDEHTVVEYSAPWNSVVVHCEISATEREDCGYAAITKEKCEENGCCFDNSIPETKWCFQHGFKKTEDH
ncbi:alpha-2-macroglobulin-like protein 1 [Anomaloglossus baeobatrachus]|uniref:alpha-2-macroglobulin-like protein 1 n=1 Tax=Anomaloglossus baeobatrachus TaxID=238106 RepID=UPI003F509ADD